MSYFNNRFTIKSIELRLTHGHKCVLFYIFVNFYVYLKLDEWFYGYIKIEKYEENITWAGIN